MRFLADLGIFGSRVTSLRQQGHDALQLRDENLIRFLDSDVLLKAKNEGRVLLTFDLDFGEIMALMGDLWPSMILFRLRNQRPAEITKRLIQVLDLKTQEISIGFSSR